MTYCDTCGHQFSDVCGTCETLEGVPVKYRKKTHFDEVRAMSVEELAEWFFTSMCDMGIQCNPCRGAFDCKYCLLEWLKQEASDA